MGLPTSGTISMDMIRAELGVPTQSPFSLNTARSGGYVALNTNSPTLPPSTGTVSLDDWYGYCQNCDTYSFSYATTQGVACINNDPITIISSTIPIGVGSILSNPDGSQAPAGYYYSDGTNWYFADASLEEETIVQSTGTCAPTSANVNISNEFFAGTIDNVQVNGVSITGASFPLAIGDGTTGTTNQIGTYSIEVFYSDVTLNSHITCTDSTSTSTCTNMTGSGSVTFTSQVIDGFVDININANDSDC